MKKEKINNISILEKRIKEKAKERFNKEYKEVQKIIWDNPILQNLKLNIKGIADPVHLVESGGHHRQLFQNIYEEDEDYTNLIKSSNISEIKKKLIDKYEVEETDNILKNISYLTNLLNDIG